MGDEVTCPTCRGAGRIPGPRGVCVGCGRAFTPNSKARWAFDRCLRPLGRVHGNVTCRQGLETGSTTESMEAARFRLWAWSRLPEECPPDRWQAAMLAGRGEPSEALSDEQESLLAHWRDGPLRMPAERIAEIRRLHAGLVRDYRAWLETEAP